MVAVHSPEQARFYLNENADHIYLAYIHDLEPYVAYSAAYIPFSQLVAHIGPDIKPEGFMSC